MAKKETAMLLEAIKNAPIVNGVITVLVCGTTFTFGKPWDKITEEGKNTLIANVGKRCRARKTSGISKRELDKPGIESQKLLLWWKYNLDKTDDVRKACALLEAYKKKWDGVNPYRMSATQEKERKKNHRPVERACKKLDISIASLRRLCELRDCVPLSWLKA